MLNTSLADIELTGFSFAMLLVVGVVHTGIAYALYFGCIDGLRAQTVALFSYMDPIVAVLLSALLLGEPMTVPAIAGVVLVIGGAVASELIHS